ncbi:MAG: ClbS/DfsB family four-helix bundle protein, partial [Bifidobacteriaceae bacterium]|nr:ClbS/DfsB family four-helix bundle protein [Bifidobacteriaceae bacterium]
MARPTTRDDLLAAAADGFAKLTGLVDGLPAGAVDAEFAFEDRDRNVRDVLWHLHAWHEMVIGWHRVGTIEGGVPAVPGEGYTWKTLPELNLKAWERGQLVPLADARAAFEGSHAQVVKLIDSHTNDQLFSRGLYPWTKSTTLGAYFVSATSSHYDWAMKK